MDMTFFTFILMLKLHCLSEKAENKQKKKAGLEHFFLKKFRLQSSGLNLTNTQEIPFTPLASKTLDLYQQGVQLGMTAVLC